MLVDAKFPPLGLHPKSQDVLLALPLERQPIKVDRLKALKGALFRSTLLTRPQTRVCGFSSPETLQTRVST